jgi:hypothetical protein
MRKNRRHLESGTEKRFFRWGENLTVDENADFEEASNDCFPFTKTAAEEESPSGGSGIECAVGVLTGDFFSVLRKQGRWHGHWEITHETKKKSLTQSSRRGRTW